MFDWFPNMHLTSSFAKAPDYRDKLFNISVELMKERRCIQTKSISLTLGTAR